MTADALHAWLHHPAVFLLALAVALGSPVVGWLLAIPIVGPRNRAGRAAAAVGGAVPAVLLVAFGIRAIAVLTGSGTLGASDWPALVGAPSGGWHPVDAAVLVLFTLAIGAIAGAELGAVRERTRPPRDLAVPQGAVLAALCAVAAVVGAGALWTTMQVRSTELSFLELALAMPVALVAVVVWTRSADAAARTHEEAAVSEDDAPDHVDVVDRWRTVGAVRPEDRPFLHRDPDAQPEGGPSRWADAGGAGTPPDVVERFAADGVPPGVAWHIGDLPDPAHHTVIRTLVASELGDHGGQVLVVGPHGPADDGGGAWDLPAVRGLPALLQALADGRLPARVHLDVDDLASGGIRALSEGRGALWARSVTLVVLARVDRGGPLATTHRTHVLRRLHLALERAGARTGVVSTGFGGRGTHALVQRAFPGTAVREARLGAHGVRPLTLWLTDWTFVQRSPGTWVRQAAEPVARAGHPVWVIDPVGSFDADDLATWSERVGLARDVTLAGTATVGRLDAAWLIAAWRALGHGVLTRADRGRHQALWSLVDEPLTRFLLQDRRIARLQAADQLPAPEPVVGLENRAVARAHLLGALYDGTQDHAALVRCFGLPLVEEVVGAGPPSGRRVVGVGADGSVARTVRLARASEDPGSVLRSTVTTQVLSVVDAESGRVLFPVDAITAPTRYYPRRVFAHGGRRYQVPLHATDAKRDRLQVAAVAPEVALTRPVMRTTVEPRRAVRSLETTTRGRFTWRAGTWEVRVQEQVTGAASAADQRVTYDPVQAAYLTRCRVLFLDARVRPDALSHLAALLGDVLRAQLLVADDDVTPVVLPAGWTEGSAPGIALVERQVQGLGVADVLDERLISRSFDWVHAILAACDCPRGCARCTPAWAVEAGELDRTGVVALLKGE